MGLVGRLRKQIEHRPDQPVPDHPEDADDEEVGGRGEEPAGFTDAPEVPQRDPGDRQHAQRHAMGTERGEGRGQGGDARRHRHRYREHVVGQERRRRGQGREDAEVVLRDQVGAAPLGVGRHRLPVRDDDDGQQRRDAERDGKRVAEGRAAGENENQQDLFGGVRDRRQRVGREHRERDRLPEALVPGLGKRHRCADEQALEEDESHTPSTVPRLGLRGTRSREF